MPKYEIWNNKELLNIICAKTFLDACHIAFENTTGYDRKYNTYWGDKLYPKKQEQK